MSTLACDLTHPDFSAGFADAATLPDLVDGCDIVVFQGNLMAQHPAVRTTSNVVVVDIYDPFHLEVLEQSKGLAPVDRLRLSRSTTSVLNEQLSRGDFFLCASGKQRDFWLGQLAGMGRINHATYDDDENLRSLIATVPFGVPDSSTEPHEARPEGCAPGNRRRRQGRALGRWGVQLVRPVDALAGDGAAHESDCRTSGCTSSGSSTPIRTSAR